MKAFVLCLSLLAFAPHASRAAATAADTADAVEAAKEKVSQAKDDKKRFYAQDKLVREYAAGPLSVDMYRDATAQAELLLKEAVPLKDNWNYGNAFHHANLALGRVRLASNDVTGAETYLLRAADVTSDQLTTFGPNMRLALDLLLRGRRPVVIQYLDKCQKFWKNKKLALWKKQVQAGKKPSFGANLAY